MPLFIPEAFSPTEKEHVMDLVGMDLAEKRRQLKTTVLHRPGGIWHREEVGRLVCGLTTEASQRPSYPEYVILFGHHTKAETLKALGGGLAYTATMVTGIQSPDLPFSPPFC